MAMKNLVLHPLFPGVAETGNFTDAAERCHVTQPTLSAGIGRLEQESAPAWFDRGRRAALTAAGQHLLPHARAMIEAWRFARAEPRSSTPRPIWFGSRSARPCRSLGPAMVRLSAAAARLRGRNLRGHRRRRSPSAGGAVGATSPSSPHAPRSPPTMRGDHCGARPTCWRPRQHRVATRDRWSAAISPTRRSCCVPTARPTKRRSGCSPGSRRAPRAVLRSANEERCAGAVLVGLGVA